MAAHTFVTNDYDRKQQIDQLQVSANQVASSINSYNLQVFEIKSTVENTRQILENEKYSSKETMKN
jgi:hypothetical protein